ncbi:MAG: protein kinase [Holophagaceae bacterium]|nr:protein kinase [Holophagaceae bacterium]
MAFPHTLRTFRIWEGIVSLLLALSVSSTLSSQAPASVPPADVQSLDSGWRFHAGDDGAWARPDLDDRDWVELPSLRHVRGPNPSGPVWFRRQVKLPHGLNRQDWGLAFGRAFASSEVYANGHLVGSSGRLGPTPEGPLVSDLKVFVIPASRIGNTLNLAIRTNLPKDYRYMEGGRGTALGRVVWIGPASLVQAFAAETNALAAAESMRGDQSHWALVITFMIMGLFHLQLYSRRRDARYYLWFGLAALCMGFREVAMTDWAVGPFEHPRLTFWASWLFLLSSCPPFIEFLWPFLDRPIPRWLRVYQASFIIPVLSLFLPLATAIRVIRLIGPFWGLPGVLLGTWVVARSALEGRAEARTIALGMLMLILGGLYELGYWMDWWPFVGTLSIGFVVFLGSMAVSVSNRYARAHAETEALNRTLEQRVLERTAELEDAQARVHRLTENSHQAMRDPSAWSEAMAQELARSLEASSVEVWRLQKGQLSKLTAHAGDAPDLQGLELKLHGPFEFLEGQDVVLPVSGMSGDLRATVRVTGKKGPWSGPEKRLLETFANQLGGALELSRMRAEVEAATQRKAATRQALIEQGAGLLQVCPQCRRCFDHTLTHCVVDQSRLDSTRTFPHRIAARYRLTRLLGEGAMGLVFEVEDERLRRRVALKAIKPEHFNSPEKRIRFEQEARALAQIQHPGVIAIYDSGELEDGTIYLVMERLNGATLRNLLDTFGPGTPAQVGSMLLQCADALDAAHKSGLIHRDIKPDNIFAAASPEGLRFKVLDFGLAKEMAVDSSLTQTGVVIGTPLYMSPEQIRDEPMDARSDLYALAVVGFEALSGQRLVQSKSLPDILMEVANHTPRPLRDLIPGLPPKIGTAFDQALAKSPWQRPDSVLAWAEQLARRLLLLRLERKGWPENLEDTLSSGLASYDRSPTADVGPIYIPDGDETRLLDERPTAEEDGS